MPVVAWQAICVFSPWIRFGIELGLGSVSTAVRGCCHVPASTAPVFSDALEGSPFWRRLGSCTLFLPPCVRIVVHAAQL